MSHIETRLNKHYARITGFVQYVIMFGQGTTQSLEPIIFVFW